eukprot:scaffold4353_cov133-Amphora_coffeaeformis.AAC.1
MGGGNNSNHNWSKSTAHTSVDSSSLFHRRRGEGGSGPRRSWREILCQTNRTKVRVGRLLFMCCLCAAATVLATFASHFVKKSEERLAREQFASLADRALSTAQSIIFRKRKGPVTLASMFEQAFPDSATWPLIDFQGFEVVSNNVIETSSGRSM